MRHLDNSEFMKKLDNWTTKQYSVVKLIGKCLNMWKLPVFLGLKYCFENVGRRIKITLEGEEGGRRGGKAHQPARLVPGETPRLDLTELESLGKKQLSPSTTITVFVQ